MNTLIFVSAAIIVDLFAGDPKGIPHPVVGFGKAIAWFERLFRKESVSPLLQKMLGVSLVIFLLLLVLGLTFVTLWLASLVHPLAESVVSVWLISTTIAAKGLKDAAMQVYGALASGDLEEARLRVGYIVGRDTDSLSEQEVSRAAVETVAENIVDAVVSPIFYALVGGVYGAILYRAVNTLDSMVGYKNDKYRFFGWASARLDDCLNFVPARICGFLLWLVALSSRTLSANGAWKAMRRDASKHPSPNSGIPEAAIAGALGIQLGGENRYGGIVSVRAKMGEAHRDIVIEDIPRTTRILYKTVVFVLGIFLVLLNLMWWRSL